ncbi:MAG: class I SAM-dependent methyltransferase [Erysipelotrichaceae bacterium]
MEELKTILEQLINTDLIKMVISNKQNKTQKWQKATLRPIAMKGEHLYQLERFSDKQAFHQNLSAQEAQDAVVELMESFKQLDVFSTSETVVIKRSKKDKLFVSRKAQKAVQPQIMAHNRQKKYLLAEGTLIPPLVDLGIFTENGEIVKSRYDKYKQINRFVEMIEDVLTDDMQSLRIVDFGCGKSYLTFILYYYLRQVKGIEVEMIGLDLKEEVIHKCNAIAQKYGYDGLRFEIGDIQGYQNEKPIDMVISLHACDTATDYALFNAIGWKAKMIFAVPCCQHEFNKTITSDAFSMMTKYGLIKERFAALATDALRASVLEQYGYEVQMLEFIDLSHSPKNILIRAIRSQEVKNEEAKEVQTFMDEFHVESTLVQLLRGQK